MWNHKHVCDTVLKTAGDKHGDGQHHDERFVHQATPEWHSSSITAARQNHHQARQNNRGRQLQ